MTHPPDDRTDSIPQYLRDSLESARHNHAASLDTLRAAVCDYVDEMQERKAPHSAIVRAIRRTLAETDRHRRSAEGTRELGALVEQMIEWCNARRLGIVS